MTIRGSTQMVTAIAARRIWSIASRVIVIRYSIEETVSPDYRGPQPPPAPDIEITTLPSEVVLQWNGAFTELERDGLTRKRDFGGIPAVHVAYAPRTTNSHWSPAGISKTSDDSSTTVCQRLGYRSQTRWQSKSGSPKLNDPLFDPREFDSDDPRHAYTDMTVDTIRNAFGEIIDTKPRKRRSHWNTEDYNRSNQYIENGSFGVQHHSAGRYA